MSQENTKVLFVDIDNDLLQILLEEAHDLGIITDTCQSLEDALRRSMLEPFDVILLRDCLNESEASNVIRQLQSIEVPPEVILFTNQEGAGNAETALKAGIWDYVVTPDPENHLPQILRRALKYRQQNPQIRNKNHSHSSQSLLNRQGIIGNSSTLKNCIDLTARIAQSDTNVLIYGESGTGKELFASAIHSLSGRGNREMTVVDCTMLPSTLVESILFGHLKGSFTGANSARQGLVEKAHESTLFLDEISEMPLNVQKKFLRVIQERTFLPVGSTTERSSDFRLIAATNRDLDQMVVDGSFREDLLFRLKTFVLELPTLRSRKGDIAELVYYCRDLYCRKNKLRRKRFSPDYLLVLRQYDWPGNVRELFQTVERSLADAQEESVLHPKHLPPEIRIAVAQKKMRQLSRDAFHDQRPPIREVAEVKDFSTKMTLKQVREKAIEKQEKIYLSSLMKQHQGNIQACCKAADISRSRLYALLKKYDLIKSK